MVLAFLFLESCTWLVGVTKLLGIHKLLAGIVTNSFGYIRIEWY